MCALQYQRKTQPPKVVNYRQCDGFGHKITNADGGVRNVTTKMHSPSMAKWVAVFAMRVPRPEASGLSTNPKSHSSRSL